MNINKEALEYAVKDVLDESIVQKYDFAVILNSARIVWDDTAVEVRGSDFRMVFDILTYDLLSYTGYDA